MLRPLYLIIALTWPGLSLWAQVLQNLVKNPSFEQYQGLPQDLGELSKLVACSSPTGASPDGFNRRSPNPLTKTPRNRMGQVEPRSGQGYAGIYAYTSRYIKRDFREYVQIELKQPMLMNERYCVSAWVYLAQSSNRALPNLGAAFFKHQQQRQGEGPMGGEFTILQREDKGNLIHRQWMYVRGTYKAMGGERYLVIGNFLDDKQTKVVSAPEVDSFANPNVDFAYYYIDDVCVTGLSTNFSCDCGDFAQANPKRERIILDVGMQRRDYPLDEDVVLYGINFEPGKALFRADAQNALDDLLAVMKQHPGYVVEISGHTSDKGNPEENQKLSTRRAKAVCDFLIASGVAEARVSYRGYGQSRPVTLNNDPAGRARNERIQLRVLRK